MTTTDEDEDPRVVAIVASLSDNAELWATLDNGEVTLELDAIAYLALDAISEGYCSARCHDDERSAIIEVIRTTQLREAECDCRGEILGAIEEASKGEAHEAST